MTSLKRYPFDPKSQLQPWDAADELLLETIREQNPEKRPRLLIVNDHFGALSCGLSQIPGFEELDLTIYTDSYLSAQAIQLNSNGRLKPLTRLQELSGVYDLVVMRIPKNMSFLEDILCHLSQHLKPGSRIICGYMVKHQSKTSFDLLNRILGKTTTSLAKKKARLIFCEFQKSAISSPYPKQIRIQDEAGKLGQDFKIPLVNHSNLFSREKLDIGTRFFLQHIPENSGAGDNFETILDLGCANGIIGLAAKIAHPHARIIFSDESEMAIESARANYANYFPGNEAAAEFVWTHSYRSQKTEFLDLILCNPPFHQGTVVGDDTAWQMFKDSHRALKEGGLLRVIGNSKLLYQNALKKLFGNSEIIAKNSKFTIVDAVKSDHLSSVRALLKE